MNLLSSLLEGSSNFQASSLLFCESPKDQISLKDLTDTKIPSKQTEVYSRPASKSLTKMGFYSPNPQINPKERLLHRIGYNLQMKCRKHYYNFFVKLQNICKKSLPAVKKVEDKQRQKIMSFSERMNQIQTILFSKYFQGEIKKNAFKTIRQYGSFKKGLEVVCSKFTQIKKEQSFIVLYNYSKKIEKQQMRIQILATSAHHVINSWKIFQKKQILGEAWSLLFENYRNLRQSEKKKGISTISEKLQKDKVMHVKESRISQADQIYKAMKERVNSRNKSPCKAALKIDLNLGKTLRVDSVQQPNFLKAYCIQTNLTEQPFEAHFSQESRHKITKRCDSDPLNSRQLNDLYDKNILFFPFQVEADRKLITQSSVHEVNFSDHAYSQATLIHPLKEVFEDNRMSLVSKNGKTNTFGSDAVSFKNSLVSERQSYKMQDFLGNMEDRREASFLKAKNFINQRRQAQDDSASRNEAKIKANSRYESAEKSYFSKLRSESNVSNFIPFPDTLPLSLNLISSQYHTAEPDYGKGPQTGRASQAESISSREDINRRPSFIKVSNKI